MPEQHVPVLHSWPAPMQAYVMLAGMESGGVLVEDMRRVPVRVWLVSRAVRASLISTVLSRSDKGMSPRGRGVERGRNDSVPSGLTVVYAHRSPVHEIVTDVTADAQGVFWLVSVTVVVWVLPVVDRLAGFAERLEFRSTPIGKNGSPFLQCSTLP